MRRLLRNAGWAAFILVLTTPPCRAESDDLCAYIVAQSERFVANYLRSEQVREIEIGEPITPWFVNANDWSKALKDRMRQSFSHDFQLREGAAAAVTVSCDRMQWSQNGELQELVAKIRVRAKGAEKLFPLTPVRDPKLLCSPVAPSLKPIARVVGGIAPELMAYFKENKIDVVEIRSITCPAGDHQDALRILDAIIRGDESVRVADAGAKYWLQGELTLEPGKPLADFPDEHEFAQLGLTLALKDRRNKTVKEWSRSCELTPERVRDDDDPTNVGLLLTVAGVTAEPNIAASVRKQQWGVFQQIDQPQATAKDGITRKSTISPYGLAVCVQGQRRIPKIENGDAMVAMSRGEEYILEIVNDTDYEAAVEITIDGLGHLAFAEPGFPQQGYVIVPAKTTTPIKGWYRNNNWSDAFLVDEYSKSEAAKLLSNPAALGSRLGTISVTFRAAWVKGGQPPPDEPKRGTLGDANATRRGPAVEQQYQLVEREIGVLRACVSVRYSRPPAESPRGDDAQPK